MKQKILTIGTVEPTLRAESDSIGAEDGDCIRQDKEIGFSPDLRTPFYLTPMHAIADGWRLMGPPTEEKIGADNTPYYTWWFEK